MLEFTANEVNQHVLADGNGMNDAFEFKAEMGGRVRERETGSSRNNAPVMPQGWVYVTHNKINQNTFAYRMFLIRVLLF